MDENFFVVWKRWTDNGQYPVMNEAGIGRMEYRRRKDSESVDHDGKEENSSSLNHIPRLDEFTYPKGFLYPGIYGRAVKKRR